VRATAARIGCSGRIESSAVLVDVSNLAVFVYYKRSSICYAGFLVQDSVGSGDFPLGKIAQKRHRNIVFDTKFTLRRGIIGRNSEDFGPGCIEFCDTRLVRFEFRRSTTGERSRVKRQDDRVLATEIREFHLTALGRRECEVGRHIADFQIGCGGLDGLAEQARRGEQAEHP
jgi:hypothetical protein